MFDDYIDEIELEYTTFLAEQELFDNLIVLGSSVYHESAGLIMIQEDFKDTINKYIEKIVGGIQKAWNVFKNKVIGAAVKPVINNAGKKIESYDGSVVVEYWHSYNMNKLDALKMVDFDINVLKSCKNKSEYYSKVYSSFYVDQNKSLKENIIDQIVNTQQGQHTITQNEMSEMFDFCTRRFKEATTKMETDINTFNNSVNNVKYTLKVTEPSEQSAEVSATAQSVQPAAESTNMLSSIYESYSILNEDENDSKSVKVVDKGTADQSKDKTDSNNIKMITWYLSGNTDVFSAKMKILRLRYLDCIKIFKVAFPMEKKKKEEENAVEVKQTNKYQIKK